MSEGRPTPEIAVREAFDALVEGNLRFTAGTMHPPEVDQHWRELLADKPERERSQETGGQHPRACILACADSRVPPEIIFNQGLGDLFIVRVAGNFANLDNQASLEYAVQYFACPLIVVLGHSKCGAV